MKNDLHTIEMKVSLFGTDGVATFINRLKAMLNLDFANASFNSCDAKFTKVKFDARALGLTSEVTMTCSTDSKIIRPALNDIVSTVNSCLDAISEESSLILISMSFTLNDNCIYEKEVSSVKDKISEVMSTVNVDRLMFMYIGATLMFLLAIVFHLVKLDFALCIAYVIFTVVVASFRKGEIVKRGIRWLNS